MSGENGEPPIEYGDGTQTRKFTLIDDVVAADEAMLESDAADGEVLNVGNTGNNEIIDLAETIRDEIDLELGIEFGERHNAEHTHSDVSKAQELFGYEPSTLIREGVGAFIDWYRENRDWYEPLVLES